MVAMRGISQFVAEFAVLTICNIRTVLAGDRVVGVDEVLRPQDGNVREVVILAREYPMTVFAVLRVHVLKHHLRTTPEKLGELIEEWTVGIELLSVGECIPSVRPVARRTVGLDTLLTMREERDFGLLAEIACPPMQRSLFPPGSLALHPALRTQGRRRYEFLLTCKHRSNGLEKCEILSCDLEGVVAPRITADFLHAASIVNEV
jgi:hypothetical protein